MFFFKAAEDIRQQLLYVAEKIEINEGIFSPGGRSFELYVVNEGIIQLNVLSGLKESLMKNRTILEKLNNDATELIRKLAPKRFVSPERVSMKFTNHQTLYF